MLGHVSQAILYQDPKRNRTHPRELLLDTLLKGEIERLGESLYHTFRQSPHNFLAFSHLTLLSLRLPGFPDDSIAGDRLHLAHTIVDQLSSTPGVVSPLTHHFAGLAAITLAENMSDDYSGSALQKLRVMYAGYVEEDVESSKPRPHMTPWNAALSTFISKKLGENAAETSNESGPSRGGLQHLADAAVGNSPNGEAADWTTVGAKGYLTELE